MRRRALRSTPVATRPRSRGNNSPNRFQVLVRSAPLCHQPEIEPICPASKKWTSATVVRSKRHSLGEPSERAFFDDQKKLMKNQSTNLRVKAVRHQQEISRLRAIIKPLSTEQKRAKNQHRPQAGEPRIGNRQTLLSLLPQRSPWRFLNSPRVVANSEFGLPVYQKHSLPAVSKWYCQSLAFIGTAMLPVLGSIRAALFRDRFREAYDLRKKSRQPPSPADVKPA